MGIVTRMSDFVARRKHERGAEWRRALKRARLERVLGPSRLFTVHATLPYDVGEAVDMCWFPQPDGGTAFATIDLTGRVAADDWRSSTELVAFTRHAPTGVPNSDFNRMGTRVRVLFTMIARYLRRTPLAPLDTAEIPVSRYEPNCCVVFDRFPNPAEPFRVADRHHTFLLCVEVHPSELAYVDRHGAEKLISLLWEAGYYPCSDLDRAPLA